MFPKMLFTPIWLCLAHSSRASLSLSIRTTSGTVNGFIDETGAPGVAQFLGIPFAEPPTNSRRWLPPVPKANTDGATIDGTKFGLSCPQYSVPGTSVYNSDAPQFNITPNRTSEDCLSLNIWAPARGGNGGEEGKRLPVIVWIYGGGFLTGGGDIEYQIPVNWVQRSQKHIIVGIKVRDNIASFGGDVSRITLWGQSAGAASVDFYNYAYANDSIVSSFIMDSGTAFAPFALGATNTSFPTVASHFNCSTNPIEQLACLRRIPQADIVAFMAADPNSGTVAQLSFIPVVDNLTKFTNYTNQTLEKRFSALPAIIGTNTNEGIAITLYPKNPAIAGPNQTEANGYTSSLFLCPADQTTKLRYQVGAKTYRYLYAGNFSNVSPRFWLGAYHSAEVPLIMGTSGQFRGNNTVFEKSVSEKMQDLWLAFASDPNGGLEKQGWNAYRPGGEAVVFGERDVVMGKIGVDELEKPCNGLEGRPGVAPPLAPGVA
ncbi:para-nitrobenzyl esterase [Venturia nashicola]|nr:para-nitrobenzyl esterase [Venturia nashicola]